MYCRSPHRRCPTSLSLAHRQQCQAPARIRSSAAILGTVDAHSHISQRSSASFRAVSDNARKLEHFTPHYLSSIRQAPKKPSDTPVTATLPAAPCRCRDCASVGCRSPRDLRKKRTRMTTFAMQAGAPGAPAQDVGPPGQPAFAREPDVDARTRRCPRGADMRAADGNDEPQFAMWTYCTREVQQNLFTPHGGSPAIWKTLSMPHAARDAEL